MSEPIAVITGAAGGVGSSCVAEFSKAGYWTIGVDVKGESAAHEHLTVDMSSPTCGAQVAAGIGERAVEVLVNNAAVGAGSSLLETTVESWEEVASVNVRAPFLTAQALFPSLVTSGTASIVNVSSVHAVASSPGAGVYATSKGGLVALTRAMALEWAPRVRANCVLPGAVDAPMLHLGLERTGLTMEEIERRHPLGRVASPVEIAQVVRFLGSEATFMTGAAVVVDGGVLARLSTE
jgi:NAD(P)-dependent dehydrogenase (short-subunit alcohol dehydrogenase family)